MNNNTGSSVSKTIKRLRQKCGISQDKVAEMVGVDRVTISQIELWKRWVKEGEIEKFADLFWVSVDELFQKDVLDIIEKKFDKKDKYYKLKLLILYITERVSDKPNIWETALNKLLYFSEFDYYEFEKKLLTNSTYVKLPYWPIPECMRDVLKEMKQQSLIQIVDREYFNLRQKKIIPLMWVYDELFIKTFDIKAKEIIDNVINRFKNWNAQALTEWSHWDMPYKATENIWESIEPRLVFYRTKWYIVNPENLIDEEKE